MSELVFRVEPADNARLANLCGQFDEHLKQIERRLGVDIGNRGDRFRISGDPAPVETARHLSSTNLYAMTETEQLAPESVHLALQDAGLEGIAERGRARLADGGEPAASAADEAPSAGVRLSDAPLAAAENAARAVARGPRRARRHRRRRRRVHPRAPPRPRTSSSRRGAWPSSAAGRGRSITSRASRTAT